MMRNRGAAGAVLIGVLAVLTTVPAHAQSGDELLNQASTALSANDASKAADLYSQAIRSGRLDKPKLSQAFLQRGRAYQSSGSHARAVADFTNALWLESLSGDDQARAHGWRATSRQALGQSGLAAADLTKAKSLNPQFTAAFALAPAAAAATTAARAPAASQNTGTAQSDGLLNRLISGTPTQAKPAAAQVATAPRRQAAPARTVQRQPAESDDSGVLGGLDDLGSGLWSGWFGSDEPESNINSGQVASADSRVSVRRLEPARPARNARAAPTPQQTASQPSLLSRILPASEPAPVAAAVPRAKPAAIAGNSAQAGPVRLVNVDNSSARAQPQTNAAATRPGLVKSLFGSSSGTVATTPSATPETITYSESRIASAPPWTLGADNPSSREERAVLPPIPAQPRVPAARVTSGKRKWTNNRRRPRREAAPVWISVPEPAPTAVPAPIRTVPEAPSRATSNAVLDWNEATSVGTSPAPAAPARIAETSTGAQTIPAPTRRSISPTVRTIPAPVRPQRTASAAQRDVAALDWDSATEIRVVPTPVVAPVPAPALREARPPQRSSGRVVNGSRYIPEPVRSRPEPARQVVVGTPQSPPAVATTSGQQPVGGSVSSRIFEVASQAFSGNIEPRPAVTPPARVVATPRRSNAESRRAARAARRSANRPAVASAPAASNGSGNYAVQVMAQRTMEEAEASAASITRRHGDVLSGARPFITRADIPGKGTYYRVRVGPFAGNQSANLVCQQLKGRGTDCFAVKL